MASGTAERINESRAHGTWVVATVTVTPRHQLPPDTLITASSPLDALVTWCDRHEWCTEGTPRFALPPVTEEAAAYAADDRAERVRVRITPVAVTPSELMTRHHVDCIRYAGTYRVTVVQG